MQETKPWANFNDQTHFFFFADNSCDLVLKESTFYSH